MKKRVFGIVSSLFVLGMSLTYVAGREINSPREDLELTTSMERFRMGNNGYLDNRYLSATAFAFGSAISAGVLAVYPSRRHAPDRKHSSYSLEMEYLTDNAKRELKNIAVRKR